MLIPNQLCQVEIRLLFSWAADEVEILYMWIKFDDLIEHVNNLMKNMLWGLIRRWIYIHHCMAAGAKLTKKKKSYVSGEREAPSMCLRVTSGNETAMAPNAHDELVDVL